MGPTWFSRNGLALPVAESYTVGLALYDYVPVVLSSIGFFLIGRLLRSRSPIGRMVLAGWALITIGGVAKATWKLILGLSDGATDIRWLDNSLFVFLGAGFVFAAVGIRSALRKSESGWRTAAWINVGAYGLAGMAALGSDGRGWFFILLSLAAIANTVAVWHLIRYSWSQGWRRPGVLFAVNLLVVLVLPGFARIPDQTIALQWTEQTVNLVAQVAFAAAAYLFVGSHLGQQGR